MHRSANRTARAKATSAHRAGRRRAPRYEELPEEELSDEIAQLSNDARPAHSEIGPTGLGALVLLVFAGLLATALILFIFVNPWLGVFVAILSVVYMLANPAVWAAAARASDRRKAARTVRHAHEADVEHDNTHPDAHLRKE